MDSSSVGLFEALGLGVLQGLTEFLPISSSAHLALLQNLLGMQDVPTFFDVMLHVGTLLAVLFFYRGSLWRWTRQPFVSAAPSGGPADVSSAAQPSPTAEVHSAMAQLSVYRLAVMLILATLPAVLAAGTFRPTKLEAGQSLATADRSWRNRVGDLREYASHRPWVVVGFLTCTGAILMIGSRAKAGSTDATSTSFWQVLGMGAAQACSAMFPGISRSGATISTGMLMGLRGEWAVHFSMLMSIPAILGAAVLKAADLDPNWLTPGNVTATAAGTMASAVVGWFCIKLLLGAVRRGTWWRFSVYVWSLAALVALFLWSRG